MSGSHNGITELSGCSSTGTLPNNQDKNISSDVTCICKFPITTNLLEVSPKYPLSARRLDCALHKDTNGEQVVPNHVKLFILVWLRLSIQRRRPIAVVISWSLSYILSKASPFIPTRSNASVNRPSPLQNSMKSKWPPASAASRMHMHRPRSRHNMSWRVSCFNSGYAFEIIATHRPDATLPAMLSRKARTRSWH